ncbi:hypothetical protein HYD59_00900 [Mycoplasmopsis bovis]|nr:hypothetical protein [Mycoplasmopsis bovis]QQH60939.1 hypothetical protein HYD59_00900 [Mycoplasmopsis bovis]
MLIQLTYAILKKKLNVHGKYKFNYVHYVIDETNWDEILTKSNLKTNKNNISPLRLKEILERLIEAMIWKLFLIL